MVCRLFYRGGTLFNCHNLSKDFDVDGYDIKILASDISTRVLDAAENGVYESERLKPVPYDIMQEALHMGLEIITEGSRSKIISGR